MKMPKWITILFSHIFRYFRIYWYIISLVWITVYVVLNWCLVINFTPFNDFDGNNLLFVVWLLLIVIPSVGKFKGLGIELESPFSGDDEYRDKADDAAKETDIEKAKKEFNKMVRGDSDEK